MSHKTGTTKKCLNCKRNFYVAGWRLKIGKGKYCSRKCQDDKLNLPIIEMVCERCNKLFTFKPVVQYGGRRHSNFCSDKCRFGEMIKSRCLTCSKEILDFPSVVKKGSGKYCSLKCKGLDNWSKPDYRKRLIDKHREIAVRGNKSPFWKGGKTSISRTIRGSSEYREWRNSVFKRDDFTCQWCKERGGVLNADHIKPFSVFPDLRFNIDNGRTLCKACHLKTDTWGSKALKIKI